MTPHFHAVVWIDHREAKVFRFNAAEAVESEIRAHDRHVHVHHKANTIGSGHATVDRDLLKKVVGSVSDAGAILVVGPGTAKAELAVYAAQQYPQVSQRILAVEPADHPTDGELVAMARKFFRAADRMQPAS